MKSLQITLYEEQGNYEKAAEYGERALKITEQVFGLDDLNLAGILVLHLLFSYSTPPTFLIMISGSPGSPLHVTEEI